ncbi:MAG: NAD-glutamate dehydrogenase, partial [Myxococcota bacterium]|nr:NAD-glutamate dehydrogenase [Myxococcota bacterium]
MVASAFTERLLAAGAKLAPPASVSRNTHQAFLSTASRQVQPSYQSRHSVEDLVSHLGSLLEMGLQFDGSLPKVRVVEEGPVSAILTVMPDQPFIVGTIRLALRQHETQFQAGVNLVLETDRTKKGKLKGLSSGGSEESWVRVEVEGLSSEELERLKERILKNLRLAQAMSRDFHAMIARIGEEASRCNQLSRKLPDEAQELRETRAFLQWLLRDNFVFMGVVDEQQRFGFASAELSDAWNTEQLMDWKPVHGPQGPTRRSFVRMRKGSAESPVHRAGRVDEIRVSIPDADGPPRVLYFQGLFTYRAVTQSSRHVPLLRRLLADILERDQARPGSYRYKGIANAFDSLPTEFLFTARRGEIAEMVERVLEAEQEEAVRVEIVQNPETGVTFVLSAMPRGRWSDALRSEVQTLLLRSTGASYCDHGVFAGRYDTMLLHYFLTGGRELAVAEQETLKQRIGDLATPWSVRLHRFLAEQLEAHDAHANVVRHEEVVAGVRCCSGRAG